MQRGKRANIVMRPLLMLELYETLQPGIIPAQQGLCILPQRLVNAMLIPLRG